jgi:hypothetical protein
MTKSVTAKFNVMESKFILSFFCFGLFLIFMLFMTSFGNTVETWNPVIQFLLFNMGIYLLVFGVIKGIAQGGAVKFSAGSLVMFLALDNIIPGYHVLSNGALYRGDYLGMASTDYFFGYLYTCLGFQGPIVLFLTYLVTTPLLLLVAAFLLKNMLDEL